MNIQPGELNQLIESDSRPLILDVRSPAEFRQMSLPDSKSMPLDQLDIEQVRKMADGHKECVVVCYTGKRSAEACRKLREAGIEGVRSLEGGLELWERKNLALERSETGGFSIIRQVHIVVGAMVVIGVLLTVYLSPWWAILPGFFGAGLLFAGLSGFCGMGLMLSKMPWNKV